MEDKKKTIAIIEDNTEVRENLAEILMLSGYHCIEAENGLDGIKKVKAKVPDLILCDVMMPELDGFGVLKVLSKDPTFLHVPFMFLTAKAEKDDFRKGMGLGADDYITKPFDDVELLEAIELRLKKSEKLGRLENTDEGLKQFYNEAKANEKFDSLSKDREVRKYIKKSGVYEEGKYPKWLYFVRSGRIKIAKVNEYGKELITHVYVGGDFFGFMPLLTDSKYQDNASALEDSELVLIPKEDFNTLLYNDRDFSAKFLSMLAHHADHSEAQLLDLAYSSVRKKVANALIELAAKDSEGVVKAMREDIAAMAGTAKETTIRTLSDFKSEGLILIHSDHIEIEDHDKLSSIPQ